MVKTQTIKSEKEGINYGKSISKKCVKNGNPFVFRKIGEEVKKIHKNGHDENVKFIMVEVEGTAKIANWEFIATLENHSSGNIII